MPQFLTSEAAEDILAALGQALDLVDITIVVCAGSELLEVIADLEKSAGR